ncbi:hypothetical protein BDV12DRAFT_99627 [Aspergillus spectabilis]
MLAMQNRYCFHKNRELYYPMPSSPVPGCPDSTPNSWTLSGGNDLPSLDEFPLDMPNETVRERADEFPPESLLSPADVNGLGISCHPGAAEASRGSTLSVCKCLSRGRKDMAGLPWVTHQRQDLESDDELWSPSYITGLHIPGANARSEEDYTYLQQTSNPRDRSRRWPITPEVAHTYDQPSDVLPPNHATTATIPTELNTTTDTAQTPTPPGQTTNKRAAHNVIEKRYRTNMNAKFDTLERIMGGRTERKRSTDNGGSLKKSEILSKAVAHIQGLQEENRALCEELGLLRQNLIRLAGCM